VLELSFRQLGKNETLYVSRSIFPFRPNADEQDDLFKPYVYIYFLFFGKIDPNCFQRGRPIPEIRIYKWLTVEDPGILVISNVVATSMDGNGKLIYKLNSEPVPSGSELVGRIEINDERHFDIFRVKGELHESDTD
jgi:hypothetical protein